MKRTSLFLGCLYLVTSALLQAGVSYEDPVSGWSYIFNGHSATGAPRTANTFALDGTWRHSNGSDEWNGDGRGAANSPPGGVSLTEIGCTNYITVEDAVTTTSGSLNNRKFYFTHSIRQESVTQNNLLDTGVTLSFRARLTPNDGLIELAEVPNGYGIFSDGKGNFGVRQSSPSSLISFSLVRQTEDFQPTGTPTTLNFPAAGLLMNKLNENTPSANVDANETGGIATNLLALDPTLWHEFWITIQTNGPAAGTHVVNIYLDGSTTPTTFNVTAGTGSDTDTTISPNWTDYITFGCNNTPTMGAFDLDFYAYKPGLHTPVASVPNVPAAITQQPTNITVFEGATVDFVVGVVGSQPRCQQWQRSDGLGGFTNIPGALLSTLRVGPVLPADSGSIFRFLVNNDLASVTSDPATLTVLADTNPPAVVSAWGKHTMTNIYVLFSELMDASTTRDAFNYSVNPSVTVNAAALLPNGQTVELFVDPATPLAENTLYTVTVTGVYDRSSASNVIGTANSAQFRSFVVSPGFLTGEHFRDISGNAVSDLVNNPKYPHFADSNFVVASAQTVQTAPNLEGYGGHLVGYITPPIDGSYTFYIRGDDGTELRLGTSQANLTMIASQTAANQPFTSGASTPQSLVAGQRYLVEALWKEGTGGDYVQVAWAPPWETNITIIPCAFLSTYADATGASVTITNQPQNQTNFQSRQVTFNVGATATPSNNPVCYQWQRDDGAGGFTNLLGANGTSYTTPLLRFPEDNGAGFRAIAGAVGGISATSMVATLTVLNDTNAPRIISARRTTPYTTLVVVFDEVLNPGPAGEIFNYRLTNLVTGVEISLMMATLQSDARTVVLTASQDLTNGTFYVVAAENIADLAGNALPSQTFVVELAGARVPVGPENIVSMEAEHADAVVQRVWEGVLRDWIFVDTRPGYSGTGAMRALPNTEGNRPGGNEAASLDFAVSFPVAITYYLWVRGAAEGGADNSCHGGLDGLVPASLVNLTAGFDLPSGYIWCSTNNAGARPTVDLTTAGPHTIHVFMREDGFYCDKVLLTSDANYNPNFVNGGLGPDETPRENPYPPTTLSISRSGNTVTIGWGGIGTLRVADEVTGPWDPIPGAPNPYVVTATEAKKFYRLSIP